MTCKQELKVIKQLAVGWNSLSSLVSQDQEATGMVGPPLWSRPKYLKMRDFDKFCPRRKKPCDCGDFNNPTNPTVQQISIRFCTDVHCPQRISRGLVILLIQEFLPLFSLLRCLNNYWPWHLVKISMVPRQCIKRQWWSPDVKCSATSSLKFSFLPVFFHSCPSPVFFTPLSTSTWSSR